MSWADYRVVAISAAFLRMKVLFPGSSKLVEELNTENVMGDRSK